MPSELDRVKDGLMKMVRKFTHMFIVDSIDHLAAYQCTVVTQNADGTLDLKPDDTRLPAYVSVPIRYGVPGISATVSNGARILLEFAGGNPQRPIATVWEMASVTSLTVRANLINLGGSTGLQGSGLGANIRTELDTLWNDFLLHTHPVATTGTATAQTGTAAAVVGITQDSQTVESSTVKVKP